MNREKKSLVISIEGGEGSGKTTVIQQFEKMFHEKQIPFLVTREPGGVRISEHVRDIILNKEFMEMDPRTEALLFAAARRQHLIEKVMPAVRENKWVVFDRFVDSSVVYQGFVRGIGMDEVYQMNLFATESFLPDLTFYLDIDPLIGLQRIKENPERELNKLDLEKLDFHLKVREGYLALVHKYPDRMVKIDANQTPEAVFSDMLKQIEVYL